MTINVLRGFDRLVDKKTCNLKICHMFSSGDNFFPIWRILNYFDQGHINSDNFLLIMYVVCIQLNNCKLFVGKHPSKTKLSKVFEITSNCCCIGHNQFCCCVTRLRIIETYKIRTGSTIHFKKNITFIFKFAMHL